MSFKQENEFKANFSDCYTQPTPHDYIAMMASLGYEIGEQSRPYFSRAVDLLLEKNGSAFPVQMLDLGCSYGMGAAFVKYRCTFDELTAFFAARAPRDYASCCEVTRLWLNVTTPMAELRCLGLDSSEPAIQFAIDAGLLEAGISRNYEKPGINPTEEDRAWFRSCNLMVSSGAVGYVTERTLSIILRDLGKDHPTGFGPLVVMTILRMFDPAPIQKCFEEHGYQFGQIEGSHLPQRRFSDPLERNNTIALLKERQVEISDLEENGKLYADLFIAAPAEFYEELRSNIVEAREHAQENHSPTYIAR